MDGLGTETAQGMHGGVEPFFPLVGLVEEEIALAEVARKPETPTPMRPRPWDRHAHSLTVKELEGGRGDGRASSVGAGSVTWRVMVVKSGQRSLGLTVAPARRSADHTADVAGLLAQRCAAAPRHR
ncbi:MAG: hypothetical protein U0X20_07350 [Caldilineaceae bacterium]